MSKILSLHGRGLKLDSRADIEHHLLDVDPTIVEEIHLGGNTIGVEAAEALGDFLQKTQVLKVADFADIFTGRLISEIPQALTSICNALKDKTSLIELNLSDNAFGGRSVDPIVPFLTTNRSIQVFKLNNNGLGPQGGSVIAKALSENAKKSKAEGKESQLRRVICGRNRLEDGSAGDWGEAFREHGGLIEIKMPQNGIRMDGIAALVRGVSACKNLQSLDLQDNTFGEEGSAALAEVLKSWGSSLESLNLSDCHLAEEGEISKVVETLSKGSNPKLRVLGLQNNNLEAQSISLLAEGVGVHLPELRRLEIQWNDVEEDDEGVQSLIGTLQKRGGKVILDDEEEEEEEKEKEEEKEGVKKEDGEEKSKAEQEADALADVFNKVSIN